MNAPERAPKTDLLTQNQIGFLTQEQAAKFLTVSPATLQDWRVRGGGPPFARIGRLIRYMRADLLAWSAARTVHPKPLSPPRPAPPLLAVEVGGNNGSPGRIATWCLWCEQVHRHGMAGGRGTTADTLDSEAALTVQRAIDDWVQRGAPKRGAVS